MTFSFIKYLDLAKPNSGAPRFFWYLLVCGNTLIRVDTKKKRQGKIHVPAEYRNQLAAVAGRNDSTRPRTLALLGKVNFTTYFFSRDKMLSDRNMLMFFLGKCVRTAAKSLVVDAKKQKALALLYSAPGPLRNAANSSVVPTEYAAEPTTKMKSSKANLVPWTFRLPPKRQLSILLNFSVPFIDI